MGVPGDEADERVAEILRLGAQKERAYLRKDELETQLMRGGFLIALFRGMFPSEASKAQRAEHDEAVREIHSLRRRMDDLLELLSSEKISEVQHLWDYERTTSLSQIRANRKR